MKKFILILVVVLVAFTFSSCDILLGLVGDVTFENHTMYLTECYVNGEYIGSVNGSFASGSTRTKENVDIGWTETSVKDLNGNWAYYSFNLTNSGETVHIY